MTQRGERVDRKKRDYYLKIDYFFSWLGMCDEWKHMLRHGADARTRTDGQMMNGCRTKMLSLLGKMAADGVTLEEVLKVAAEYGMTLETYQKTLPPVMDEKYMKDAELIPIKGKAAYEVFAASEDLAYLKENMQALEYDRGGSTFQRIRRSIGFVDRLKEALEKDDLLTVRACMDVEKGLDDLEWSRAMTEMRIKQLSPFEEK